MEYLSEEHLKSLLHKEWLVKVDNSKSIPYMMKFYSSSVDQCCCIMITDTRHVWGEVMSSKQFARRWRDCNSRRVPPPSISDEEEDEWRGELLDLLNVAHSLGGIADLTFEVVDSRNADFAFEISNDEFKWQWETYALGPKVSAEALSQHLIMPLISVTHLAFGSAEPVGEMTEANLEKAVDKVGRTARRTVDTHVKHVMSKPRVVTTLRRMAAMFSFLPDLPPIVSETPKPDMLLPTVRQQNVKPSQHSAKAPIPWPPSPSAQDLREGPQSRLGSQGASRSREVSHHKKLAANDSETERSSDEDTQQVAKKGTGDRKLNTASDSHAGAASWTRVSHDDQESLPSGASGHTSHSPSKIDNPNRSSNTELPSSALTRPTKRAKRSQESSSEDEDSETERKRRLAKLKASSGKGVKQPLKLTKRRF